MNNDCNFHSRKEYFVCIKQNNQKLNILNPQAKIDAAGSFSANIDNVGNGQKGLVVTDQETITNVKTQIT